MKLAGWGRYPVIDSDVFSPLAAPDLRQRLRQGFTGIARGLGRSYGDSALAAQTIHTRFLDHFLAFDESTGVLRCAAGVSLADVLRYFVPRGWFFPTPPGTKFVTIGGAIASDVHGKNHHAQGSFARHVRQITLMLADGQVVTCSPQDKPELFRATCGGMGLTGVILDAEFTLKRIRSSHIRQTTLKAGHLTEALDLFEQHHGATYSVAWIDCLATGARLGRSLLMLGEHADDQELDVGRPGRLTMRFDLPSFCLNRLSIAAFNSLYYRRVRRARDERLTHYEPFFFPLDGIGQWNRMYGRRGFTQYQFVIPKQAGAAAMTTILERIAASKRGSFLAVLKVFGPGNENYLSFPAEGYTLALDFKIDAGLFAVLDELDRIVLDHGGRLYLTKDVRMSEATFKRGYPRWEQFAQVKRQYDPGHVFRSVQSDRLGL